MKVLLIGDSVLDNDVYVGEENSVSVVLEKELSKEQANMQIFKEAVDGYTTKDVVRQIGNSPFRQCHTAVLSIGGNDLLQGAEEFLNSGESAAADLTFIRIIEDHKRISAHFRKHSLHLLILNLYYPFFEGYMEEFASKAPFWIDRFNKELCSIYDKSEIIEIDKVFTNKEDFTNVIEPSAMGTVKLVQVIVEKVRINTPSLFQTISSGGDNA